MTEQMVGTLQWKNMKIAKGGKKPGSTFANPKIDGVKYFCPGKAAETLGKLTEGIRVKFGVAPPNDPDSDPRITWIAPDDGTTTPSDGAAGQQTATSRPAPAARQNKGGENVQLSIFYGYAKDLVVAGLVKPGVGNVQGVVNAIETLAWELSQSFSKLSRDGNTVGGTPAKTAPEGDGGKEQPTGEAKADAKDPAVELANMEQFIDGNLKEIGVSSGIKAESVQKSKQNFMANISDPNMWAEKYTADIIEYRANKRKKSIVNGGLEFVAK